MPIEIRELIIKASVDNSSGGTSGGNTATEEGNEATINEIAERVFEIIKEKAER